MIKSWFYFLEDEVALETTTATSVWETVKNWLLTVGIKVVIALIIMLISFWILKTLSKRLEKFLLKKNVEKTTARVLARTIRIVLQILVIASLVSYVGIETSSITAIFTTLGLGISLAVQGAMSNIAGSILITTSHPFKIGDFIETTNVSGTVEDINLIYTHIRMPNNKVVLIPNSSLTNNVIINYSVKENRRVDISVPLEYDCNIDQIKAIVSSVIEKNPKIVKDPAYFLGIDAFNDSSISLSVKVWCANSDYWDVYFYLFDEIKQTFDEKGIIIPYNKLDVYVKKDE